MTATSNIPLKVPFKEKDEAKSFGARWNPGGKHWYIPEGVDVAPFEKWMTDAPAQEASMPNTTSTTSVNQTATTANTHADIDDINAMLRDAIEDNDAS